jgi:hypothetical protein
MTNLQKRLLLFLLGCIPTRLLFVYIAKRVPLVYLPYLGYLALLPAIGFVYLFLTGKRTSGPETFGEKIWWNNLRPVHALLYFAFAVQAIRKVRSAWTFLLADVVIGLASFLLFHYENGDLAKALQLK